jgi:hypothetical protein
LSVTEISNALTITEKKTKSVVIDGDGDAIDGDAIV